MALPSHHPLPRRGSLFRGLSVLVRLAPLEPHFTLNWVLLCRDLDGLGPQLEPIPGVAFGWAGSRELSWISTHPETSKNGAHQRRAAAGHRCYCATREAEVAAFSWVSLDSGCMFFGEESETRFLPLGPGEAFTHDLYTYEPHRRQGLGLALKRRQLEGLRDEGVHRAYALVQLGNLPSLLLHRRLGSRPQRLVYSYFLGGWRRTFLGPDTEASRLEKWFFSLSGDPRGEA